MGKTESMNISLTDELKQFIESQSGNGTLFTTPDEYVRNLIRHEKERLEANALRNAILDGYNDAVRGDTMKFSGDLLADLNEHKHDQM